MALGGGMFVAQNKILPGAYLNFVSAANATSSLSDRGIACLGITMDWGESGKVFLVTKKDFQENSLSLFGYPYVSEELKGMRDLFQYAVKVYLYRINEGEKAACELAEAKYSGKCGNEIQLIVAKNVDDETKWDVVTYFRKLKVDQQIVGSMEDLADNAYLVFKRDVTLVATAGMSLINGTTAQEVTGEVYQAFLTAMESYHFHTLGCLSDERNVKSLFVEFTKRLRNEQGIKFQTVVHDFDANYEGVINVKNDLNLVYWVTGASAGCEINRSNTNKIYHGEYEITSNYNQADLEEGIRKGEFIFHKVGEEYHVLTDINSLVTVSESKGEDFKSNQTLRILDQVGNDIAMLFASKYLGKIQNDKSGRVSLWSDIINYYQEMQRMRAIEDFVSEDVIVESGGEKRSVVVYSTILPVNCMEKLYMTVLVK